MISYEEYKRHFDDGSLSEAQMHEMYLRDKTEWDAEVQKRVDKYQKLDMNLFISRIGGMEKIEEMKRINDSADDMIVVDGRVVKRNRRRSSEKEDIDEWKRGFMEGFEEAYNRFNKMK